MSEVNDIIERLRHHGREGDILNALADNRNLPHSTREAVAAVQVALNVAYANGREDQREDDADLLEMVRWAYSKLCRVEYSKQEDALMLDRMKLLLTHGA